MNHLCLDSLSNKNIKFEVAQSKKCLEDHNIDVTSFAYPFDFGSNDKKVVNIVSKYYDLAALNIKALILTRNCFDIHK